MTMLGRMAVTDSRFYSYYPSIPSQPFVTQRMEQLYQFRSLVCIAFTTNSQHSEQILDTSMMTRHLPNPHPQEQYSIIVHPRLCMSPVPMDRC